MDDSDYTKLTADQKTAILLAFSDTLMSLEASMSPEQRKSMRVHILNVVDSTRSLAEEIGAGDTDVAMEIIRTTARLVATIRNLVSSPLTGPSLH